MDVVLLMLLVICPKDHLSTQAFPMVLHWGPSLNGSNHWDRIGSLQRHMESSDNSSRETDQIFKLGVEIFLDGEPRVRYSLVEVRVEVRDHLYTTIIDTVNHSPASPDHQTTHHAGCH